MTEDSTQNDAMSAAEEESSAIDEAVDNEETEGNVDTAGVEVTEDTGDVEEDAETPVPLSERAARELSALKVILRKTRRRMRAPLVVEGLAWFVATLGAVIVSSQFLGLLLGELGPTVMRFGILIGGGAAVLAGLVALVIFFRGRPSLEDVARTIQRHVPRFKNDIVAALQFGRQLQEEEQAGWSPTLAFAHLERTTRKLLGEVDGDGSLRAHLPSRSLTPALLAIGGCLALLLAPYAVVPDKVEALWLGAAFPTGDEDGEETEHRPIVGDIDLLFSFPPYADLQPKFEPFTTGHIETLVGAEVTMKTYPLIEAAKYEVVVDTSDGTRVVPMKRNRGRLEATLLLTKAGSYHFRATLGDGTTLEDGIDRPIVLQPDQAPAVEITSHAEEVEVSPDEVLEIEFTVNDDYGIDSITYAHGFSREDPTVVPLDLPELSTGPDSVASNFELDLRSMSLQPKDVVTVWVEATDNNSLTGPGVGRSTPLVLRVASPEDRHMKLVADEQAILEALLDVLADFLENPAGERHPDADGVYHQTVADDVTPEEATTRFAALRKAHGTETKVLSDMAGVLERMREDPLMTKRDVTLFESLYEQLYALNRDGEETFNRHAPSARRGDLTPRQLQRVADWAAKNEDALEKGLIRLDSLLATQKMDSVERTADEIRKLKERLKGLLEKYRETRDPELKKAILREIQRLRQRMAELLSRMQSQLKELPEQHVNMEALQQEQMQSDAAQMGENLQKIEDLLEKGDIDGALEALDQMTANLDSMTGEMDQQFANAQPEGLREMDKALSELMDDANDLEARQRDLEQRTLEVQEQLDEQERRRTEKMLDEKTREIRRMAQQQRERLEQMSERDLARHDRDAVERAGERVKELEEMLENRDIEQALEQARSSHEDLRALEFSLDLSQRYTDDKTSRGQAVRQTRNELSEMAPRSRRITRKLEEIMEQARQQQNRASSPQMQQLAQEQNAVEGQAQELRKKIEEKSGRFPMLGQKLGPPLDKARGEMGKAEQGLQKRRGQQALDHQRSALEQLRQLKQSMRDALQKQKQGNKEGPGRRKTERVTIPEKEGRSQEAFREDLLDGMKQERIQDYQSEIERYYESLME
jgi:hypothetical protein